MRASDAGAGSNLIRRFDEITIDDISLVGGKNASLGEMHRELGPQGINLADGFAITAEAYRYFLRESGVGIGIESMLAGLDSQDAENLQQRGRRVRQAILAAELPVDLRHQIVDAYHRLAGNEQHIDVAVRSSATAEDLPNASFAGQQETYLNFQGDTAILDTCRRCFASLFTDRAISYREDQGFDHFQVALSIGVQRLVRSAPGAFRSRHVGSYVFDRDSGIVAHIFDERNPAVTRMITRVIQTAKACGRKIGICGQALSDYPEFALFLVEQKIDSISLTPDVVVKTTVSVLDMESDTRNDD